MWIVRQGDTEGTRGVDDNGAAVVLVRFPTPYLVHVIIRPGAVGPGQCHRTTPLFAQGTMTQVRRLRGRPPPAHDVAAPAESA